MPLGMWPGIWSGIVSAVLFIVVSLVTTPPTAKADEFISYVNGALKEKNAI
jgi:SSS family solute:Na+ symporter